MMTQKINQRMNEVMNKAQLFYAEIAPISSLSADGQPNNEEVGLVLGLVDLNDEVEYIVRFDEGIKQLNDREFKNYVIIETAQGHY